MKTRIEKWEFYQCVEIGEAINESGRLGESLLKSITEIVSRVGGDDENGATNAGEKNRDNGATCGLADAAFASDEDPLESLLAEYVLQRPFRQVQLIRHGLDTVSLLPSFFLSSSISLSLFRYSLVLQLTKRPSNPEARTEGGEEMKNTMAIV